MSTGAPMQGETSAPRPYASFTVRLRALFVDAIVVGLGFTAIIILGMLTPDVPGSGRVMIAAIVVLALLYEPILVWRFGSTVGHRRNNLRVVADATGGNPSLPRATLRFVVKSALGMFSFVTMGLTRRHQAVHDRVTETTVQIRDLDLVQAYDVAWEREEEPMVGLPSRARRIVVIVAYEFLLLMAMGLVTNMTSSQACLVQSKCSLGDDAVKTLLSLSWLGASAWAIIYGWRGRLAGARRAQ
jgi:uncharacterized RDD family membrane protein YckC